MKKLVALFMVGMLSAAMIACGQNEEDTNAAGSDVVTESSVVEESPVESESEQQTEAETETQTQEETVEAPETETESEEAESEEGKGEEETNTPVYTDNFSVDAEAAAAFAKQIKDVVAAKDLEALADLTGFPTYVGFTDGGMGVETREDFIALGADKIFTDELLESIAGVDETTLSASRAGFSMSSNGGPNVNFGVRDGKLMINGMNY